MSRHDAIANSLGIAAAIAFYTAWWFLTHRRKFPATCFLAISIAVLAYAWTGPVRVLWDVTKMKKEFPLLASFESDAELSRWFFRGFKHGLVDTDVSDGNHALEVEYPVSEYAGVTLVDMVPDWNAFSAFEIDMTLHRDHPVETETAMIQFIDSATDAHPQSSVHRFVQLHRGQRVRVKIPLNELSKRTSTRNIDLAHLLYVDVAIDSIRRPTTVTIDRVMLID